MLFEIWNSPPPVPESARLSVTVVPATTNCNDAAVVDDDVKLALNMFDTALTHAAPPDTGATKLNKFVLILVTVETPL